MDKQTFKLLTGLDDQQDDLERVNCREINCMGHFHCGWNMTAGKPAWQRHNLGDVIISGSDYVDADTVPEVLEFETMQDAVVSTTIQENKKWLRFGTRIRVNDNNKSYTLDFDGSAYFWREVA